MSIKSNFKRTACIMMSSLTVGTCFSPNRFSYVSAKNQPSAADIAMQTAKAINISNIAKSLQELVEVHHILQDSADNNKGFENLGPEEQGKIKDFYKKSFNGNNYEFQTDATGNVSALGFNVSHSEGDGMRDILLLIPHTYKDRANYQEHLVFPEDYRNNQAAIQMAARANSSLGMRNIPGGGAQLLNGDDYEKYFYQDIFISTRSIFMRRINHKLQELSAKLKSLETSSIERFFNSPAFKFGGGAIGILAVLLGGGRVLDGARNIGKEINYGLKDVWYKISHKGFDLKSYDECLGRIETRLRAELVGQDEAIDRVIDIMRGYFASMVEANEDKEKFEGGLILYLTGSPATGKSTMMKIIQEEMQLDNFMARMSDVIEDRNNNADTVAARLTKSTIKKTKYTEITIDTPLVKQLNLRKPTLYLLDEIDKMRLLDSSLQKNKTGNISDINSIDELLRNFIDTGHIAGINASGSILIATSNETDDDMMKLESSLRNRYSQYRVKFKDLDEEDYKEIIRRGSAKLQQHYKNKCNTEIEWSNNALSYFADKFVKEQAGGRCAEPLMMKIRSALANFRQTTDITNKKLSINVAEGNDKKIVIEVLGDVTTTVENEEK